MRDEGIFLKLMYITNNPEIALIAEKYGVDRIWLDLEKYGKEERQKNMNTVKSNHTVEDIWKIKPLLTCAQILVRINPINHNSKNEINSVIEAGADIIMLPMWKSIVEVKDFLDLVKGRTKTTLLLETKEAVECVDEVLRMGGFDEIHIGLNDLCLSYGLTFMFEFLSNGIVEGLCRKFKKAHIPYGFGGIAAIGEGLLPAEKIIMEHYRIGSTRVILSRAFCDNLAIRNIAEIDRVFSSNMNSLKSFQNKVILLEESILLDNKKEVKKIVDGIVKKNRRRK